MPLLYSKATEVVAQGMHWVNVPASADRSLLPDLFNIGGIREDLVNANISMGLMQGDGEMRRRHRFADQSALDAPSQRARLLWKTLQTVWPHHSLRGDDWNVVPCETQPTMPMR